MAPTTADIRKFLTDLFSDEELTVLCYDYFRDVYDDFALGMSKGQKIQRLIERCDHREAIPSLLAALSAERAAQYRARFGAPVEAVSAAEQPRHVCDPRQVFISHAHEDAEFAHRLAADLGTRGWRVWIAPDSILPGEKWVDAIERGLAASGIFIVALTPAAIRSRWVKTETNAAIALEHREALRFVPLEVEPCDAPLLWSGYQFVSFRGRYEDGLRGLLNWLDPSEKSTPLQPLGPIQKPRTVEPRGADAAQPADSIYSRFLKAVGAIPTEQSPQTPARLLTIESPIHLELIRVPAGEFLMGSDPKVDTQAYDDEQPQHRLILPEFYIGKHPVTNEQYAAFVKATRQAAPQHWENGQIPAGKGGHPVVNVTWRDAVAFCQWLSQASGKPLRLSTEAEWEKAARGADGRIYPWGNAPPTKELCNFGSDVGDTTPVGWYPAGASPCGMLDMAGNVWEWTGSLYRPYPYQVEDGHNRPDDQRARVLRGSAFSFAAWGVRCAARGSSDPLDRSKYNSFRVVASRRDS